MQTPMTTDGKLCDDTRALVHALHLGAISYTGDMTDAERDDIAACYGLPWSQIQNEMQGEIYTWYFRAFQEANK